MENPAPATPQADPTVTTPSERVWEIDTYVMTPEGLLPDPLEVERAMRECGAILSRIGGVMSLATVREELSPGRLVTTKILVRWQSFVPKMSNVVVQDAPPPAEAPETVAASNGNGSAPAE